MSRHARTLTWVAIVAATTSAAQPVPSVQDEVDAYRDAIAAAESAATRGVESAFAAVVDLREALLALEPGGKQSILEGLSDIDFARVEQLPGVLIRRVEILVVHPDAEYFVTLATRVGDQADRRFAAALAATYPNGHWPIYVRPQTDYSGCTAFGAGDLLEVYLAWSAMERDFPRRYGSAVKREREAVVEKITSSTCACGDAASVVGELERMAAALARADPIRPAVYERLAALEDGRSNIRFGCISG